MNLYIPSVYVFKEFIGTLEIMCFSTILFKCMSFQFSYHLLGLIWALIGPCGLDHLRSLDLDFYGLFEIL